MKLVRYGHAGREKPGMLDAHGALRDLSQVVSDIAGDALTNESIRRLRALDPDALPKVEGAPRPVMAGPRAAPLYHETGTAPRMCDHKPGHAHCG